MNERRMGERRHAERRLHLNPIKALIAWYRSLNGNRWLFNYLVPMGLIALLSIAVMIYALLQLQPIRFAPLGDYPVQVVDSDIAGVITPTIYLGNPIRVHAVKCNVTPDRIVVIGQTTLVRREANAPSAVFPVSGPPKSAIREAGCHSFYFVNVMPVEATPGAWRLEGFEATTSTGVAGEIQTKPWVSQEFIIVAKP